VKEQPWKALKISLPAGKDLIPHASPVPFSALDQFRRPASGKVFQPRLAEALDRTKPTPISALSRPIAGAAACGAVTTAKCPEGPSIPAEHMPRWPPQLPFVVPGRSRHTYSEAEGFRRALHGGKGTRKNYFFKSSYRRAN
jgi:hypothetical protein